MRLENTKQTDAFSYARLLCNDPVFFLEGFISKVHSLSCKENGRMVSSCVCVRPQHAILKKYTNSHDRNSIEPPPPPPPPSADYGPLLLCDNRFFVKGDSVSTKRKMWKHSTSPVPTFGSNGDN